MNPAIVLRAARARAGLSQRALARRAGMAQSTVARIERGHLDPRHSTLARLLSACGSRLAVSVPSGVDRTLIRERLARTPRQRVADVEVAARGVTALRGARPRAAVDRDVPTTGSSN